jgi:hypothetical protein
MLCCMPACNIFLFMLIQCHLSQSVVASCSRGELFRVGSSCLLHDGVMRRFTGGTEAGAAQEVPLL